MYSSLSASSLAASCYHNYKLQNYIQAVQKISCSKLMHIKLELYEPDSSNIHLAQDHLESCSMPSQMLSASFEASNVAFAEIQHMLSTPNISSSMTLATNWGNSEKYSHLPENKIEINTRITYSAKHHYSLIRIA